MTTHAGNGKKIDIPVTFFLFLRPSGSWSGSLNNVTFVHLDEEDQLPQYLRPVLHFRKLRVQVNIWRRLLRSTPWLSPVLVLCCAPSSVCITNILHCTFLYKHKYVLCLSSSIHFLVTSLYRSLSFTNTQWNLFSLPSFPYPTTHILL